MKSRHAHLCFWLWVLRLCPNIQVTHHNRCNCVCLTWAHLSPIPLGWGFVVKNAAVFLSWWERGHLCITLHLSVFIGLKLLLRYCCLFVTIEKFQSTTFLLRFFLWIELHVIFSVILPSQLSAVSLLYPLLRAVCHRAVHVLSLYKGVSQYYSLIVLVSL